MSSDGDGCAQTVAARTTAATKPDDDKLVSRVRDLYERDGLSTRRIAKALGVGRGHVDRALRSAGVPVSPRGAGRPRPTTRHTDADDLPAQLQNLYADQRLTRRQTSEKLGLSEGLVRSRLTEHGIGTRTRGQHNREDRRDLADDDVLTYYQERKLSAEAAGELLGVSHRILLRVAHDHGVPVRPGVAAPSGTAPIKLLEALYADAAITATLRLHDVPIICSHGPIWERFPVPVPLTDKLCAELYVDCGVSTTHIELLTGQPAAKVGRALRDAGIALRPPGGRSPFRRRWEAGHAETT